MRRHRRRYWPYVSMPSSASAREYYAETGRFWHVFCFEREQCVVKTLIDKLASILYKEWNYVCVTAHVPYHSWEDPGSRASTAHIDDHGWPGRWRTTAGVAQPLCFSGGTR